MNSAKIDPRAIRTRRLITDAFDQLMSFKDFDHISVKDITSLATINRATFYSHFVDKYELADVMLTEKIQDIMNEHFNCFEKLDEKMIIKMFQSISQIHKNLFTNCRRGYDTFGQMIEEKVKETVTLIVSHLLKTDNRLEASMFSWALYGAFVEWELTSKETLEDFAKTAASALLQIIETSSNEKIKVV